MADLLASQEQLKRAIERSLTNFKKLGKANWTVPVLHTRINHLQTQWKDFEVNDAKLAVAISPEDQKVLAYFQDQHFATTEEMYVQILSFMSTTLADLKPKENLDSTTRKAWTLNTNEDTTPPTFEAFEKFLDARIRALADFDSSTTCHAGLSSTNSASRPSRHFAQTHVANQSQTAELCCPLCRSRHYLGNCPSFLGKSPQQRRDIAKRFSRCLNCLSLNHALSNCASKHLCRFYRQHHSLLHDNSAPGTSAPTELPSANLSPSAEINSHSTSAGTEASSTVLLATARVQVRVPSGRSVTIRALIDQGSEASFVTESVVQLLRAKRLPVTTSISAVGGVHAGTVRHAASLLVSPRVSSEPSIQTNALILGSMSTYKPPRVRNWQTITHLVDLSWADHDPSSQDPILMILGADVYPHVILNGLRKGHNAQPIAQKTIFGWVISGPFEHQILREQPRCVEHATLSPTISTHHCVQEDRLGFKLRRFWELEEIPHFSRLTPEEKLCEQYFRETTTRNSDGRYVVRLPFRAFPPLKIGQSRQTAEAVMHRLTRRLMSNSALASEYRTFMDEYERLGHMRRVANSSDGIQSVYIPHHPVLRESSSTTHLRVVFNASSVTSNGTSLNDHLLPGPKLQSNLAAIILRCRAFRFVYTADIAKMYRQILVDQQDINYQRIVCSPSVSQPMQVYQLLTVTYGMTCAPYLALRVLQLLTDEEGHRFPLASPILKSNTYVDDILFGHDDIDSLRRSRNQLIQLLDCAKFKARKWASNHSALLSDLDPSDHGLACEKDLSQDDQLKVLGIRWNPALDMFQFKTSLSEIYPSTKRTIFSSIAKFYDPLGWVTPFTLLAKVYIQDLWRLRVGWDETIPASLLVKWQSLYSKLSHLDSLKISRWIGFISSASCLTLHGFSDASNVAYSAVVYARCTSPTGEVTTSLLAGKSKVAPLHPVTIPRLELQGACLLVRLMELVLESFDSRSIPCVCWTDSTVVLNWLRQHPSRWKTFVANRVANIQMRLPQAEWRHVPTETNPADCASRGLLSDELLRNTLWWQGPAWLKCERSEWPTQTPLVNDDCPPEAKVLTAHIVTTLPLWELESRFSSWPKLLRVTAYILRFIDACRGNPPNRRPSVLFSGPLGSRMCSCQTLVD